MFILDENINFDQTNLLNKWKFHTKQIGYEIGHKGLKDDNIIPVLHKSNKVTFITRDLGLYKRDLCNNKYCLVCLAVTQFEVASFVRKLFGLNEFNNQKKRNGKVILVNHTLIKVWKSNAEKEKIIKWK